MPDSVPPPSAPIPSARAREETLLGQILLRMGYITNADLRRALAAQEEKGGQIGRILVAMGAVSDKSVGRALVEQVRLRGDKQKTLSTLAREYPDVAGLSISCKPWMTTLTLVAADWLALGFSFGIGMLVLELKDVMPGAPELLLACAVVSALAFPFARLYAAMALSPPDEIRATTFALAASSFGVTAIAFFADKGGRKWTFVTLVIWWLLTATMVPVFRHIARRWGSRQDWWGFPVVVLGAGKTGRLVVRTLQSQPERGLVPVMLLDDDPTKQGTLRARLEDEGITVRSVSLLATDLVRKSTIALAQDLLDDPLSMASTPPSAPPSSEHLTARSSNITGARGAFAEVEGVPVVGDLSLAPMLAGRLGIKYAVLAMPGVPSDKLVRITERAGGVFTHMLIIPDLFGLASLGVPARDVGGILGLEVRQQLLLRGPRAGKRAFDLTLTILGGLCILPLCALIGFAIVLDSRGGPFYGQSRLGQNGGRFNALKFRTMHGDGEERLKALLASDPKLHDEYTIFHKLKNDPRVTRVGKFLRKYSLDELPQLWNVVRGDMSLVGPRPYLEREIADMNAQEGIILRAPPGVTGLWQVSDRNAIDFHGRVRMDVYYVRNWSPWLDLYILARTFGAVLRGTGM